MLNVFVCPQESRPNEFNVECVLSVAGSQGLAVCHSLINGMLNVFVCPQESQLIELNVKCVCLSLGVTA